MRIHSSACLFCLLFCTLLPIPETTAQVAVRDWGVGWDILPLWLRGRPTLALVGYARTGIGLSVDVGLALPSEPITRGQRSSTPRLNHRHRTWSLGVNYALIPTRKPVQEETYLFMRAEILHLRRSYRVEGGTYFDERGRLFNFDRSTVVHTKDGMRFGGGAYIPFGPRFASEWQCLLGWRGIEYRYTAVEGRSLDTTGFLSPGRERGSPLFADETNRLGRRTRFDAVLRIRLLCALGGMK